jgi:hypothetical protein
MDLRSEESDHRIKSSQVKMKSKRIINVYILKKKQNCFDCVNL